MRALLVASRPFSWINTCLPFLAAAIATGHATAWPVLLGALYFLVPFNLLMYGVNDLFDYESDRRNPRKGGVEGALLPPAGGARLWAGVAVTNLPFLGAAWWFGGPPAGAALTFTAFTALAYSAPPLRTKVLPGLDSITSSLHFTLPALCGALAAGAALPELPWRFLAAFFLWGVASQSLGAIQDVAYDRAAGLRSIATWLGTRRTASLSTVLYLAAAAIVATAGGGALLAGFVILPYALLSASCLGGDLGRARQAWRGFMGMNLLCGFVLTQLLLHAWGVGPRDTLMVVAWSTGAVCWLGFFWALASEVRLRPRGGSVHALPSLTVVIVARDADPLVAGTLRSVAAQCYPSRLEIVIVAPGAPGWNQQVGIGRVVTAAPPPPGWSWGSWARWTGASAASGQLLLFLDPGTRLASTSLVSLVMEHQRRDSGLLSVVARPLLTTPTQRCLAPAGLLFELCCSPLALPRVGRWTAGGFGPSQLLGAEDYRRAAADPVLRSSDAPELELARVLVRAGVSARSVRGKVHGVRHDIGTWSVAASRWRRAYYSACGRSLPLALLGLLGPPAMLLLPPALALGALATGDLPALIGALWGVAAVLLIRTLMIWREGDSWRALIWHPLTFAVIPVLQALSVADGLFGEHPASRSSAPRAEAVS